MSRRTQKRKVRSMLIVLLLTAMLLVSSTYAWFSTNRRVQITNITARVVAAEGLQISLDASHWSASVAVTAANLASAGQNASVTTGTKLSWPDALEPVSTTGDTNSGTDVVFMSGVLDANEADLLNVALFGKTASEWKTENPNLKGNIRDYATIEQLLVIANMESYNAILIEQNVPQSERLIQLNNMAKSQLRVLENIDNRLLVDSNK